ncbi:MAG: pitrilysin family protein [Elusimicrobiota bacterium]
MKNIFEFFISSYLITLLLLSFSYSVENKKLKNGITVIFDTNPSATTTAIQIWISAGAVNEDEDISGISHFIEHLIFKGTPTRTQKQIAPEIEKLGGIVNAATSKDFTYFYSIVPSSYSFKATEILADAVLNPLLSEEEIEKERKVILEEIKRSDDNPQSQLFNEFYKYAYPKFSCYTKKVIGTEKTVSKLKRDDFLSFHKKFYIPKNIFVVVAGNFNEKEMFNFLKNNSTLAGLEKIKRKKDRTNIHSLEPENELSQKKIIKKNISQTHILMGFPAASIKSKDQFSLDIASYVLGTGRASRLYKKLVEETKLAYTISVSFATHRGPGLFYVYAECLPENTSAVSDKILTELNQLTFKNVTYEELDRAKALLMRDKLLQEQTPDGKAEELGFYTTLGNRKIAKNYIKNIKKVKPQNIKSVISKYLISPNIPTVVITP